MADWNKIKKDYIRGGVSYRQLAAKYAVPLVTLKRIAAKEGWVSLRAQANAKTELKIVDAVSNQGAKLGAEIYEVADLLLSKLRASVEGLDTVDSQALRQYTAALKDLKDIKNIRSDKDLEEQTARIAKLRMEAERKDDKDDSGVEVVLSGEIEGYCK